MSVYFYMLDTFIETIGSHRDGLKIRWLPICFRCGVTNRQSNWQWTENCSKWRSFRRCVQGKWGNGKLGVDKTSWK